MLHRNLSGYRVARIRLIFKLPRGAHDYHMPSVISPGHLAYVEWYTAFTLPDRVHGMYRVSRCLDAQGHPLAEVVEVRTIRRSCQLLPVFGGAVPREWTSSNVLDSCKQYFVNPFSDTHMYMTLF